MDRKVIGDSNSVFIKFDGFDNLAQPGFRVKDVLSQLHNIQSGETLIIGVGVNDCAVIKDTKSGNKFESNLDEFKVDYQELIELAKGKFNRVVVLGLVSSTEEVAKLGSLDIQYPNKTIEEFNEAIKIVCENTEVEFVNLLPHFLGKEKELMMDHIHPNDTGKEIILSELQSLI